MDKGGLGILATAGYEGAQTQLLPCRWVQTRDKGESDLSGAAGVPAAQSSLRVCKCLQCTYWTAPPKTTYAAVDLGIM